MKIFKYNEFLNESNKIEMRYSAYDWDDNILHMDTIIHMEHLVDGEWLEEDVSTEKFAIVRKDNENWRTTPNSYDEFRDWGRNGENTFLEDVKEAVLEGNFGPSWKHFIKDIVNGKLFSVITTRGHEPKNIAKAIEWIIYNYLTDSEKDEMLHNLMTYKELFDEDFDFLIDEYLDNCILIGISSKWFKNKFKYTDETLPNVERRKEIAFDYYVKKLNEYGKKIGADVVVGFSDDDPAFADAVRRFMGELKSTHNKNDFYVFYTDTSTPKKVKV